VEARVCESRWIVPCLAQPHLFCTCSSSNQQRGALFPSSRELPGQMTVSCSIACLISLASFSLEARWVSRSIWRLSLASSACAKKTGRSLPTASSRPHAIVVHATAPTSSRCPRGSGRHVSPPTLLHMALTLWLPLTLTLNLHRTPRAHPKPKAAIHIRRHHTPITKVWRSCPGPIRTCTAIVRYQPHSPAFASTWRRRHR